VLVEMRAHSDRQLAEWRAHSDRQLAEWRAESAQLLAEWRAESEQQRADWRAESEQQLTEWRAESKQQMEKWEARSDGQMAEIRALMEKVVADGEDLRVFIRDSNRRSEKLMQQWFQLLEEWRAEQRQFNQELLAGFLDLKEEIRALTGAILTLIDRLPPPAQAA